MNDQRDSLTGLLNRSSGLRQLEGAVAQAKQAGQTAAIVFLDIEHFSDLNCTLGHLAGDDVLRQLADRLQRTVEDKGVVCRSQSDEFFVVLPLASEYQAKEIATQISEQPIKLPFDVGGHVVYLKMTMGMASYPASGGDAESLLQVAEKAAPPTKWCRRARQEGQLVRVDGQEG